MKNTPRYLLFVGLCLSLLTGCAHETPALSSPNSGDSSLSSDATFLCTFQNWDGSVLAAIRVVKGDVATYSGSTPSKPSDTTAWYAFQGWDKPLESTAINQDTVFTAVYLSKAHQAGLTYVQSDDKTYAILKSADSVLTSASFSPSYEGLPVQAIGNNAFMSCLSLTSVVWNDAPITSIGNGAFQDCVTLAGLAFPSTLQEIGRYAFFDCLALTSFTLPASVTAIGEGAFSGCPLLASFSVEAETSFKVVGGVLYDAGLTRLLQYPLASNASTFQIPASVKTIDACAFYEASLESIDFSLATSLDTIGEYAFSKCPLTEVVLVSSLTSLGNHAFSACAKLRAVTFAEGLAVLPAFCFAQDSALEVVNLPSSLLTIENSAFFTCGHLRWVVIPLGTLTIGPNAFSGCSALTIRAWTNAPFAGWDSNFNPSACPILFSYYVPGTAGIDYTFVAETDSVEAGSSSLRTEDEGKTLYNSDCTALLAVAGASTGAFLPVSTITSIADYAFFGSALTSIDLRGVGTGLLKTLPFGAFYNCSKLTTIRISRDIATIGTDACFSCPLLATFSFSGTKEQWGAVSRAASWHRDSAKFTAVTLSDDTTVSPDYAGA